MAIIQPYAGGNPSGDMTMYDGSNWFSDFRQNGMYPGQGYRDAHPPFKICLLAACSVNQDRLAVQQVTDFYAFYLNASTHSPPPGYDSPDMQRYVAAATLQRLAAIETIPEQEILNSSYFTYGQDYDPAWIPAFRAGPARDIRGVKWWMSGWVSRITKPCI